MRRHRDATVPLQVQAIYSIPALARIANVSWHLMARLLRANGVRFIHSGRSLLVPLQEVRDKIPPLWDALRTTQGLGTEAAPRRRG
jgi:hypothetical protein